MQQVLIILAIIAAFIFIRWVSRKPLQQKIWWVFVGVAVVFLVLFAAGKLNGLIAGIAAGIPILIKTFTFLRPFLPNVFAWLRGRREQTQRRQSTRGQSATMSTEQACQILGLQPGCSRDEIITAHRKLIQKAHPDQGGSPYLAALINQARDHLLSKTDST